MITLRFSVDDIDTVIQVYDIIQVIRSDSETGNYTTVSGLGPITLLNGVSSYELIDSTGIASTWYKNRYYSISSGSYSGWSEPVLGGLGGLFHNPVYPPEMSYGTSEKLVITRIRRLIGDPKSLRREYGPEAISSIHSDGKVYEFDGTGYPVFITIGGVSFNTTLNPTVDGYKFLRFKEYIDDICSTCSGITNICGEEVTKDIENGIDIWRYSFRNSDRQIMQAYDGCPPPIGLTAVTATSTAYMLQTAIDIIQKELLEDAVEDGAQVQDENSKYDPEAGLKIRKAVLDDLRTQLKDLINASRLLGITGVLID